MQRVSSIHSVGLAGAADHQDSLVGELGHDLHHTSMVSNFINGPSGAD